MSLLCVEHSEPLTRYIFNFWAQLNFSSAYLQHTHQDAKKCSSRVLFLRAAIYFHTLSNTPTSPSLSLHPPVSFVKPLKSTTKREDDVFYGVTSIILLHRSLTTSPFLSQYWNPFVGKGKWPPFSKSSLLVWCAWRPEAHFKDPRDSEVPGGEEALFLDTESLFTQRSLEIRQFND